MYVNKMGQTSPATESAVKPLEVIDVVRAASAGARESGEEPSTVTYPPPTLSEVEQNREAGGGWSNSRPIEVGDVVRAASANARKREA